MTVRRTRTSRRWRALGRPVTTAALAFALGRGVLRGRHAERAVERLFELSLDPLVIASLDGHFTRVNPAFVRMLGYPEHELLTRPFAELIHPEDLASSGDALEALARGREIVHFENRYIRADGSPCWLEWSVRPMPAEGLLYCAARDVTGRRRAEEELREAQREVSVSRDRLRLLADEQAALRRVATLVAQGATPLAVFDAVAAEIRQLLDADATRLYRYEADGSATVLASSGGPGVQMAVGTLVSLEGENAVSAVRETRHSARLDSIDEASGSLAAWARAHGVRCAVGSAIILDGHLWGAMVSSWNEVEPVLAAAEERMVQFTELVATAIANAESRAELQASRARVVAASDATRRRIERDLHDGTQQRLVALALALRAAEASVDPAQPELRRGLAETADGLARVVEDLQEISRGIHPAILSKGGLGPALKALVRRTPLPTELAIHVGGRLPEAAEVAAYYVVSEALANAAKHAAASMVQVDATADDGVLVLVVRDDGVGGADPGRGSA